jgi:oligopeptide transport system ATP-binding protein
MAEQRIHIPEKRILEVKGLTTFFFTSEGVVRAVDCVSFDVHRGRTLGIVGESGSGKSVTALSILRLVPSPPGKIISGEIRFEDRNLLDVTEAEMRKIRGNRIAMIFQDPMTSLNPVFTVGEQIMEAIILHQKKSRREARDIAIELLERVGIPKARDRINDYPHQFSGGMRQRVMIAMALSCHPSLLIADEPTTALDVTIQAQILELIQKVRDELDSGVILITHNLSVVAEVADEVAVMYAGKIVESGVVNDLFYDQRHPYTWGLLNSLTRLDQEKKERLRPIRGLPPSLINLPKGCNFNPRCEFAQPICFEQEPELLQARNGNLSACHFRDTIVFEKEEAG